MTGKNTPIRDWAVIVLAVAFGWGLGAAHVLLIGWVSTVLGG